MERSEFNRGAGKDYFFQMEICHGRPLFSGILALSSDQIDFKVLEERIKDMLLEKEWNAAKSFKM